MNAAFAAVVQNITVDFDVFMFSASAGRLYFSFINRIAQGR